MLDLEIHDAAFDETRIGRNQSNSEINFQLIVYPIPAKEELFIKNYELISGKEITVLDISGRIVLKTAYSQKVNIANLVEGIYLIKVNDGVNNYFSSFVKSD